ncbi:nuclear transport factor 2 family protein [Mitsuaria sp. WAJ17]|uniref:nuclear transport factor 2 family protein n=1 Tax=Mitsuaria sp. WAJ17 TaxID=2761452 RepID=UPI0015FEED4E|nr:nuclear transport factor 2 family protein [Mitsuaria sp. WAJ17]MBB2486757.1 nuclear transport factor 2 family protein [Mitsuaria sp. WAJ17]
MHVLPDNHQPLSAGEGSALVRRFWALYQARRWSEAQALLAPSAECLWWATQERFRGADAVVHVNAVYPEGWTIHLLDVQALADGRVLSLVRVDQDGHSFYANSYFLIRDGLIQQIDEYWSDVQAAPAWRRDPLAPLVGRAAMAVDRRCGLPLALSGSPNQD